MKTICSVYRSPKKEGMYLYVEKAKGLDDVPEALLQQFGKPEHAMVLVLQPEKKLARVDALAVLESLKDKGFYLQMPPVAEDDYMRVIHEKNSKIGC